MNNAVRNKIAWSNNNTCTTFDSTIENCFVYLHGNHIASVDTATNKLTIKDGGWQSVTTKSRLNALLDEFAYGMRVIQRDFVWYLDDRFGNMKPFVSGMTVD